jgi:hypothetical protein
VLSQAPKTRMKAFQVVDEQQGGMVVERMAVPEGWRTMKSVRWNYNDFYTPVRAFIRAEAPDGSAWLEFFPSEIFWWLDPPYDSQTPGTLGGLHHYGITLPEALARYVVGRARPDARNLRIIGTRAVNNMPVVFRKIFAFGNPPHQGMCMRVQYQLDGANVDEEFYACMSEVSRNASTGAAGVIYEYSRQFFMVHSLGARNGRLESLRPLLGGMASTLEPNPGWMNRLAEVRKMQADYFNQALAAGYDRIRAAGQMSQAISANNDRMIAQLDAARAQGRAQAASSYSSTSNESFNRSTDDFDQYIRGTEHMRDQNGNVSDQPSNYNYHWTDGFGRFVHTDDPNLDPNRYLNGTYERMTPAR